MATKKNPPRNATLDDLLTAGLRYSPVVEQDPAATVEPDKPSGLMRRMGDVGISALKGAIAVPEAAWAWPICQRRPRGQVPRERGRRGGLPSEGSARSTRPGLQPRAAGGEPPGAGSRGCRRHHARGPAQPVRGRPCRRRIDAADARRGRGRARADEGRAGAWSGGRSGRAGIEDILSRNLWRSSR